MTFTWSLLRQAVAYRRSFKWRNIFPEYRSFSDSSAWKNAPPVPEEILLASRLSYLVYWAGLRPQAGLTMRRLRELADCDPDEHMEILQPAPMPLALKLVGFSSNPGPKSHYEVHRLIRGVVPGFDLDAVFVCWDPSINAALIHEPSRNRCTLVLRGTADLTDLAADVNAYPWALEWSPTALSAGGLPGGRVHLGFYQRLHRSRISTQLLELGPQECRIVGHSMGGAIGVLLAAELVHHPGVPTPKCTVITFGCPRVGNEAFSQGFNELPSVRHWRVQNGMDPITRVPPAGYDPLDFRHTGHHIWLTLGAGTHSKATSETESPKFTNGNSNHSNFSTNSIDFILSTTSIDSTPWANESLTRNGSASPVESRLRAVSALQAARGSEGVRGSAPEVIQPRPLVVKDFIAGLKGEHKMGGVCGYVTTIEAWVKMLNDSDQETSNGGKCSTRSLVERFYEEMWNACKTSSTNLLISPTFTFRGCHADTKFEGLNGFVSYLKSMHLAFGEYHCKIVDVLIQDDKACVRTSITGIHLGKFAGVEPTYKKITWSGAAFLTIDAGLISDMWVVDEFNSLRHNVITSEDSTDEGALRTR